MTTSLDLSRLPAGDRVHLAGMGLRVNKPGATIIAAQVDGVAHPAFSADTVILPPRTTATSQVTITTGDPAAAAIPRLTYLSKAPAAMTVSSGNLRVQLARPGLPTRFCLVAPTRHVLIGADRYAPEAAETCGRLDDGSPATAIEARTLAVTADLSITAADRRILSHSATSSELTLELAAGRSEDRLTFRASRPPEAVHVDDDEVTPTRGSGGAYTIELDTSSSASVTIEF